MRVYVQNDVEVAAHLPVPSGIKHVCMTAISLPSTMCSAMLTNALQDAILGHHL